MNYGGWQCAANHYNEKKTPLTHISWRWIHISIQTVNKTETTVDLAYRFIVMFHCTAHNRSTTMKNSSKSDSCSLPARYNTEYTFCGETINKIRFSKRRARCLLSCFLLLQHEISSNARWTTRLSSNRSDLPPRCRRWLSSSLPPPFLPVSFPSHCTSPTKNKQRCATSSLPHVVETKIRLWKYYVKTQWLQSCSQSQMSHKLELLFDLKNISTASWFLSFYFYVCFFFI